MLHSSFYYPELNHENETWIKISPQGLILYGTSTCHHFFAVPPETICIHSFYDFLDPSDHNSFADAILTESSQVLQCSLIGAGKSNICLVRILRLQDPIRNICWLQVKKKPMEMMFMDSDTNLFSVVEGVKSSSIFYECNKLKVKNSKILEEIESVS
jgi:hypothetical protein